jgi:hypothetical protein
MKSNRVSLPGSLPPKQHRARLAEPASTSTTSMQKTGSSLSGISSVSATTSGTGMSDAPDDDDSHGMVTLRNLMGVSVGCIVTISVLVSLVPTTILWSRTSNSLSDTAAASTTSQAAAYRAQVVAVTKLQLSAKLGVPFTVSEIALKEITNATTNGSVFDHISEMRAILHSLSSVFPDFSALVRWIHYL